MQFHVVMFCLQRYTIKTIPTKSKNALIVNCTWGNHLPTCLLLLFFRPLPRPREKAIVVNLFACVNNMVISGSFQNGNTFPSCRGSSLAQSCNQCGSLVLLRQLQSRVLILAVYVGIPVVVQRVNNALCVVLTCAYHIALVL